jgi:Heparinase II/III-like protein
LLCRTALEYWLACRLAHRAMLSEFESRIRSMFELANELLRPDGSLPRFGDNSPDRIISDLWGLMSAAHHHGLLKNAPRHSAVTPLTFFYCGYRSEKAPEVLPTITVFRNGGFAFLRSAELKVELTAHGDSRKGVGAHGDSGRGSYELWWNGNVLVREPGSFFSGSNANWRLYQGAEAQNVTSLDGLSPAISKQDERFVAGWYRPLGGNWRISTGNALEFRCDAFQRLRADITLVRTWRLVEPDTLFFEEVISGNDHVKFESRICLGDTPWTLMTSDDSGDLGKLRWCGSDGATVDMTIRTPPQLAMTIRPCTFLPEYGVERNGRTLVVSGEQKLPCVWNVQWKFRKAS